MDTTTSTEAGTSQARTAHQGRKESAMDYQLTPVEAVEASGTGALAGFESRCSCGLVIRSSLRSIVDRDVWEHGAWHVAKGDEIRVGSK